MAKPNMVTLYHYYNTAADGMMRCEEILAKETAKAYTYGHPTPEEAARTYGRPYRIVLKDEMNWVPRSGVGDFWTLQRDDIKVRKLFLDKLECRRCYEMESYVRGLNDTNSRIIALGGKAEYPVFVGDKP